MSSSSEKGEASGSIREKNTAAVEDKEATLSPPSVISDKEDEINEKKRRESPEDFDIEAQDVSIDCLQNLIALLTCS
jgi:hypothetical protein